MPEDRPPPDHGAGLIVGGAAVVVLCCVSHSLIPSFGLTGFAAVAGSHRLARRRCRPRPAGAGCLGLDAPPSERADLQPDRLEESVLTVRRTMTDLGLAAVASYVGTKAMDPVSMRLYEWESDAARAREDAARPGAPYRIAAERISRLAGQDLDDERLDQPALVFHCGLAFQWAPLAAATG